MRKLISLLLIFSIAGHASVCNLYTLKDRAFKRAKEFRRVSWAYQLKAFKQEFTRTPFHEILADYISTGISKNYLDQGMIDQLFKKMRNSRHVSEELLNSGVIDQLQSNIKKYDTGYKLFKNNIYTSLNKKNYSLKIKKEIEFNIKNMERLKHLDAQNVSSIFNNLSLKNERDVDIFFNLVLVTDTFSTTSRRYYLDNFNEVFKALRERDPSKLTPKTHKVYKRYRDIESSSSSYRRKRQELHGDADLALKEYRNHRRIKTMCRTRHLNTLGGAHKKLFKRFSYGATILATAYGFHSSGALYAEEGWQKFSWELFLNMLSMWAGAEATAADGLSNKSKLIIWYLKGYLYNFVDKKGYEKYFDDSSGSPLLFDEVRLQKVVSALSQNEDIAKVFKRIDEAEDSHKEAQTILKEHNFRPNDDSEISTEVLDLVTRGISERMAYEEKHRNNSIKRGTEAQDRYYFNNIFTLFGNAKAFLVFLLIYRTFCAGHTVGPHTIGGVTKPLQALGLATGILFIDRMFTSSIYYGLREEHIGQ